MDIGNRVAWYAARGMRTLILDPHSTLLEEEMERRRRSGLDRLDEIWKGVYHMVPAPDYAHANIESQLHTILRPLAEQAGLSMIGQSNLGEGIHDFRVPDCALHRPGASGIWHSTAALVVEIVSPSDESWEKLPFYAEHHVNEVLIVDPQEHSVSWLALTDDEYRLVNRSALLDTSARELADRLKWPPVD